jgi:bifunctional UDP-N-acetylglucosamine pyrophosphorylase/glucosamine-1-phosphate N-acetyltransferase
LGNFSEVKNTTMKEGAKANHLAYLGDAIIGKNANIGAGSITCNYDGIKKSPTHIQDHAFIGSNVNLIAPVTVGAHSVIGAGSTISENVPPWALALERSEKRVKKNWAKKKFKKGS